MTEQAKGYRRPVDARAREMDEAVAYALGHPTRNEALSILAEGPRTTGELAKIMRVDSDRVNKHVGALYKAGCIESAGTTPRGNIKATLYRTVILPYITDEAYRAMTTQERRDVNGVTTQAILSETLASYRAGKMELDESLWLLWDALVLDPEGRQELAAHNAGCYDEAKEIQARAAGRMCKSGEAGTMKIITSTAFERSRPIRPESGYTPSISVLLAEQATATRKPVGERERTMDKAVAFAVGNPIRNEALSILAEGPRSPSELAKIMGLRVERLANHIRRLYKAGCIASTSAIERNNVTETFYRTALLPYITDEAYRAMTTEERRDVNGVTTQAILTETLASYRAGKMETDENLWLLWDALRLDPQGQRELADHNADSYEETKEIQTRAARRMCHSGETGTMTIVTSTAFERSRPVQPSDRYAPPRKP